MTTPGTFTLGSLALELHDLDPDLGAPAFDYGETTGPLSREPAQTLAYVSAFREQTWPVRLAGLRSTEENARECAVRLQHNLSVELAKGANVLAVTRRDSAVVTTWRVKRNQVPRVPFTRIFDKGGILYVPVTLTVAPWAEGEAVSQVLASALATPNVVDFTVAGSRPAELELTVTRAFTGSGLQTFLAALIPSTFDLEDLLLLAKDASAAGWDAYTATSGYESGSDNVLIATQQEWRAMYWGDAQPAGRYGLFVKCRIQTGGKGWLAQCRTGNDQAAPAVAVTDTDWDFVYAGDWASDGYTPPRIVGKSREAGNGLIVDWMLPVPLDLGSPLYFHCKTLSVQSLVLPWLGATLQTTGGSTRSALRWVRGSGIEGVGALRMLAAASNANGDGRRPAVSISETHTPLFDHWVPTTEA